MGVDVHSGASASVHDDRTTWPEPPPNVALRHFVPTAMSERLFVEQSRHKSRQRARARTNRNQVDLAQAKWIWRVVVPAATGSSPVTHPYEIAAKRRILSRRVCGLASVHGPFMDQFLGERADQRLVSGAVEGRIDPRDGGQGGP